MRAISPVCCDKYRSTPSAPSSLQTCGYGFDNGLPARRGRAGGVRTIGEVLETRFGRFDIALRLLKLFLKCEIPPQTQHHFRQPWKVCILAIGEIRPTLLSMGDAHRGSAALLKKD